MGFPLITVLLPVYNGENDVLKAVDSILGQEYTNFELLIINDGSSDQSAALLNTLTDMRVRIIHQENHGLARTLNLGLQLAQGDYIARQDQDDISHPERLKKQIAYMQEHPECALLGTRAEIWQGDRPTTRAHDHPTDHASLCFDLLYNNPFVHSSVMFHKEAILELGGYTTDPARQPPEDFELWSRIMRKHKIANLPERLIIYREVAQSMSRSISNSFLDKLVTICAENIAFFNGIDSPNEHCFDIAAITHSAPHRLSGKPELYMMSQLIFGAAQQIDKLNPGSNSVSKAKNRVNHLHKQHFLRRTNLYLIKNLASSLLTKFKRLY